MTWGGCCSMIECLPSRPWWVPSTAKKKVIIQFQGINKVCGSSFHCLRKVLSAGNQHFGFQTEVPLVPCGCFLSLPHQPRVHLPRASPASPALGKVGHAGMERRAQHLAYGKRPTGSLVTWTSPGLHQISLSNFLADCPLAEPPKQPWLYKWDAPLPVPRGWSCKGFPVDRNTGNSSTRLCRLNICVLSLCQVSNPAACWGWGTGSAGWRGLVYYSQCRSS